jgi:hypothetical protein
MIEIESTFSKTTDAATRQRLRPALGIATATARHIKRRLLRGEYATRPQAFSTTPTAGPKRRRRYYISLPYARAAGLGDKTSFASSAEMHRMAGKTNPGQMTGELLRSMRTRNYGRDAVIIEFGRSSIGGSSKRSLITKRKTGEFEVGLSDNGKLRARQVRELSKDSEGNVKRRKKPRKVLNWKKATAVFAETGIGLLQPTPRENTAQLAAIADRYLATVVTTFGGVVVQVTSDRGDQALFRDIQRRLDK